MNEKRRFHFRSTWRIRAGVHRVYGALVDVDGLCLWWPGVATSHLAPSALATGEGSPLETRIELRSLVPVTLDLYVRVVEARRDAEVRFLARGDLAGVGVWQIRPASGVTEATLTWDVTLTHPLSAPLSRWCRPLFSASHHWLMWRGERGLNRALKGRTSTRLA